MKLDYDLIKELLETVEETSDGFSRNDIEMKNFQGSEEKNKEYMRLAYHYKILADIGLIYGEVMEAPTFGGNAPVNICYTGLTFEGQKTLEAMRSDTVWKQIKEKAKMMGVEGLKKVPGLAIELIMKGTA